MYAYILRAHSLVSIMVDATSGADLEKTEDPNKHVLDYLRYYCELDNSFDFAVLLKGPWGAGKTYLINKFLTERAGEPSARHLYVSLYGITSFRQIEDAFFRQLHPFLSSKGMKVAATLARGALKTAFQFDVDGEAVTVNSQLPELDLFEYFKKPKECLLIFDDLERCSMRISDVLGYINAFVEHEGFKVVILGNEDEILKREDDLYREIKEKLIGQTLAVRSTARSAVNNFLALIRDNKTRDFLRKNIDDILLLHSQSESENLRILKQALWDFERLAVCFSEKHWQNGEAVGILFRVVLALSLETRRGKLKAGQFAKVQASSIARYFKDKDAETPGIAAELDKRYPETDFSQTIVSSGLLKALLVDGLIDQDMIRAELDRSPYYAPPGTEPAWKIIWQLGSIDDDEFEDAVAKIEEQFRRREFVIPGEMFHVFGARLLFSDIGAITASNIEVVDECKRYLDDLHRLGKILNKYIDKGAEIDRSLIWQNAMFYKSDTKEFTDIICHYRAIIDLVAKASLPEAGQNLLTVMKNDPEKYIRMLCPNNYEESIIMCPYWRRSNQMISWSRSLN
jgi:hypothetical protein